MDNNRLKINCAKSKLLQFTTNYRKIQNHVNYITFGHELIKYNETVKFLGLKIDTDINCHYYTYMYAIR